MSERPVLMNGSMVNATLQNRKTKTRRTRGLKKINESPNLWHYIGASKDNPLIHQFSGPGPCRGITAVKCPYGSIGDRLWVRETSAVYSAAHSECGIVYRADHATGDLSKGDGGYNFHQFSDDPEQAVKDRKWAEKHGGNEKWIPSIYMPRFASRITLEITGVHVERLQEITEVDAKAEGIEMPDDIPEPPEWWSYVKEYGYLWNRINGEGSWDKNEFVFVVEFRRV